MNKILNTAIFLFLIATSLSLAAAIPATELQAKIDQAESGSEVLVEAGEYAGSIKIKNGIILRGAGDDLSIIDGQGAGEVVALGKNSAIIGFTIRNGGVLIGNRGNFAGVFECSLLAYKQSGVLFGGGSGVLANNRIQSDGNGTGVMVANANPLVVNNLIANNQIGVQVSPHLIPTITDNLFSSNAVALSASDASVKIVSKRNIFSGNGENTRVIAPVEGNDYAGEGAASFALERGASTASYRDLMRETFASAVADHPIVVYDLHPEPGSFNTIGLFPWASFSLSSSTLDTRIQNYAAYDVVTRKELVAEYESQNPRPTVRVHNPDLVEKMRERYVLDNVYVHPESYFDDGSGRRVFKRLTNVSQIEVVIPTGFELVSCSPEGRLVAQEPDRSYVAITSMGETQIELTIQRSK